MTKLFRFNIYNRISFSTQADLYAFTIQMVSDQQLGEVAFDDVYLYKADNAYVAAIDAALTLFGTSIGDLIARGLDWVDPLWKKGYARSNGYILNRER